MKYSAIISGHIWVDKDRAGRDIEILSMSHNDHKGFGVFDDIEYVLLDEIDIGNSEDYYFIAVVQSEFVKYESYEGFEWDIEHTVEEIKDGFRMKCLDQDCKYRIFSWN